MLNFPQTVTYSLAHTLVPTYECFNRCSYCNFRADPKQSPWLDFAVARSILSRCQQDGIQEILILSGEVYPGSARRSAWFDRIYDLGKLALEMGFLPHTNAGPLSRSEMERLAEVNVSMGLMVEQTTSTIMETVHRHAPSKSPEVRLQQLQQAGELRIPFTTGILLGLGETEADRYSSLEAIAEIHKQHGHIQEVILQPYSPGSQEVGDATLGFDITQMPEVVAMARSALPSDIAIQIPPNLVAQPDLMLACLNAGASDLGGISPHDEVNPDYPHPTAALLRSHLEPHGWKLKERLAVYPQYDHQLSFGLQTSVAGWRSRLNQ
ncbi:MAG: 7,8-didemethyl-8-hydroxy-5-deazariboflavin synthase subunit CofG [Alkalinema sp. RU_4_3]|nr:7,8-didemethyl-8-hydroxy-5-deazariboflavin synthase subunit CofG [Alkalinema sp. RU_4_3]